MTPLSFVEEESENICRAWPLPQQRRRVLLIPSVGGAEKATFSKVMAFRGTASCDASVRGTDTGDAVTLTRDNSEGPSQLQGSPCSWLGATGQSRASFCPLLLPVRPQVLNQEGP